MSRRHKCKKGFVNEVIGYPQSQTNRTNVVPVAAKSDYELALESGAIPPDTTLEQWLNRPSAAALEVIETTQEV